MNKITTFLLILTLSLLLSACGSGNRGDDIALEDAAADEIEAQMPDDSEDSEEADEMNESNRKKIADALGIDEGSRSIRFILGALDTIDAGLIKSAEAGADGDDSYIEIIAEDDTTYRVYLSGSGSVDAVKNMDTGEWPVKADR